MRKLVTSFAAITAISAGAAVLQLKMTVQEKTEEVRALAQKIHDDQAAIRVLEAEWAYLTTPRVLQDRSIQFLALMPPKAKQVLHDPVVIPLRPRGIDVDSEADNSIVLPVAAKPDRQKASGKQKTFKKKEDSL